MADVQFRGYVFVIQACVKQMQHHTLPWRQPVHYFRQPGFVLPHIAIFSVFPSTNFSTKYCMSIPTSCQVSAPCFSASRILARILAPSCSRQYPPDTLVFGHS
jgi:hypothetical protein